MVEDTVEKNVDVKRLSPIDVYALLPRINCKKCDEENCLAFARKVVSREIPLEKCPPLLTKKHYTVYRQLKDLLKPSIKEVVIGVGENAVKVGGKLVMYRHEFTYCNPTAIAVDLTDEMPEQEMLDRINEIEQFSFECVGQKLKLDMIALRSTSSNPEKFKTAAKLVAENTKLPIVLCSLNPKVLEAGLMATSKFKPLLYAATEDNLAELAQLALTHHCAVTILAPNNLVLLKSLTKKMLECGVEDIVLDPGTFPGDGLADTLNAFTVIRRDACKRGDALFGFPIIGVPLVAWTENDGCAEEISKWREAYLASMLILRFADILIMHGISGWAILPVLTLRQNIYTDPRKPVAVKSALKVFGAPGETSPVMFTTNFALTYYTVASDLESAKINAYLIIVDTGGIAVDSAVAGRKLTAEKVATAIKTTGIENKVKHRKLIIPGKAARLRDDIEKLSGWQVLIGPRDSSDIPGFLKEKWEKLT